MIPDQRVWCAACAQHHLYPAITGPRLPAPDLAPEWRTAAARLAELEQAARAVACRLKQRGWIPADCDETRRLRDALGLGPDPMGEEVEDDRELTARAFEMVKARFPEAMNLAVTINRERDDAGYVQTQLVIILDLIEPMGDK